jgi:hypothetical protein
LLGGERSTEVFDGGAQLDQCVVGDRVLGLDDLVAVERLEQVRHRALITVTPASPSSSTSHSVT